MCEWAHVEGPGQPTRPNINTQRQVLLLHIFPSRPLLARRPAAGGEGGLPEGNAARLWTHRPRAQVGAAALLRRSRARTPGISAAERTAPWTAPLGIAYACTAASTPLVCQSPRTFLCTCCAAAVARSALSTWASSKRCWSMACCHVCLLAPAWAPSVGVAACRDGPQPRPLGTRGSSRCQLAAAHSFGVVV
jgi:hypothetical protein